MPSKDELLKAFKAFSFDKDSRWEAYLQNIELPGTNADAALLRVKAKWYKKNVVG
jgi:hypothetical protein